MKLIISHLSPDFDSITATWLIKRYLPGWSKAILKFVPAGKTYKNQPPDNNQNIIHVDTGLGRFDHHQTDSYTCATKLVFDFLKKEKLIKKKDLSALEKLVDLVNQIDHFQEINFPNPAWDLYEINLYSLIDGLKKILFDDEKVCLSVFPFLDAALLNFKNKIQAEDDLNQSLVFQSQWGKSIAIKSTNEESLKLALKTGFDLAFRYDQKTKNVRIKIRPDHKKNLSPLYQKLKEIDPTATWFFHASKKMLLNGSSKNPSVVPTQIPFLTLIEIIKKL